ncbi:MAG: hypothetical protein NE334_01665 [Lentisphaeraceae bacterium]|nr:hypothetical protein [Lentisphaeraceae bacterium]
MLKVLSLLLVNLCLCVGAEVAKYDFSEVKIGVKLTHLEKVFGSPNNQINKEHYSYIEFKEKIAVEVYKDTIAGYVVSLNFEEGESYWTWATGVTGLKKEDFKLMSKKDGSHYYSSKDGKYKFNASKFYITIYSRKLMGKIKNRRI